MSTVLIDMELFAADLLRETGWFSLHHRLGLECEIVNRENSLYQSTNNLAIDKEMAENIRKKKAEVARSAMACVRTLIDDLITSRLNWAGNETAETHHEHFKNIFPAFDYDSSDKLVDLYINEVYDPFYCRVDDLLAKAMPRRTWFQWTVTEFAGTLILHKGRDWRVMEWERITGFTNLKPTKKKPARNTQKKKVTNQPVPRTPRREGKSKEVLLAEQKQQKEVLEQQAQEEANEKVLKGQVKNTMKRLGNVRVDDI